MCWQTEVTTLIHLCPCREPIKAWKGTREPCPQWRRSSMAQALWVSPATCPSCSRLTQSILEKLGSPGHVLSGLRAVWEMGNGTDFTWKLQWSHSWGWEEGRDHWHRAQTAKGDGSGQSWDQGCFIYAFHVEGKTVKFSSVLDGHFAEPKADVYHSSKSSSFPSVPVMFCTSWDFYFIFNISGKKVEKLIP